MTLRRQTLLAIGATGFVLTMALYALSSLILLRGVTNLEEKDTEDNVQRVVSILEEEQSAMDLNAHDWASWDATYAFVQDHNEAYIQENLMPQTMVILELNLLLLTDSAGQVVWGMAYDAVKQEALPVPEELQSYLGPGSPLVQYTEAEPHRGGLLLLPDGPMLVVSWPIRKSSEEGPARGTLIMGRTLNMDKIARLANLTDPALTLYRLDDPALPVDCAYARDRLAEQPPPFAIPLDDSTVAGYTALRDVSGTQSLLLRVTLPRPHYQQGRISTLYLLGSLLIVTGAFGAVTLLLLERLVLRRVFGLSTEVDQIRTVGALSARVSQVGQDELTRLAGAINDMLAALDASQQALLQSEGLARQEARRLEALRDVGLELGAQLDLQSLLHSIVAHAIDLLEADDGGLYLYRAEQEILERVVSVGGTIPIGSVLHRGEGLSGQVWATGHLLIVDDYQQWDGKAAVFQEEPSMAIVGVPVRWGERLVGILNVAAMPPRRFSPADAELLSLFATQAAVALENARLYADLEQRIEQLKRTQAQLVQSARLVAVGELAAGVAHQLNNSLTPIQGYAELLAESLGADSVHQQDLRRIIVRARQSSEIVRNLLDFARQMKPQKEMVHINDVVRRTLALIRVQLEKAGLTIEEDYAADLDQLSVDAGQMGQVLLNLINNAAEAMPVGGRLGLQTSRDGGEIVVAVSDTGPGLSPDAQAHLFEPFFSTRPGRTGLGLAVSLGIVQEHGGRIEVTSAPGQGSTFTVWLPLPDGADAPG